MKTRLELHKALSDIPGVAACYFSPPEGQRMKFPCIEYHLEDVNVEFADNRPYIKAKRYSVTVISEDPDCEIPDLVLELPHCMWERSFTNDGMYHHVFVIYV